MVAAQRYAPSQTEYSMEKILISSCLLGNPVRYDGRSKPVKHPLLTQWLQQGRVVSICPEVSGGLSTPRVAAELQSNGQVLTQDNQDVSAQFQLGAEKTLALCLTHDIKIAILKQSSPSCGNTTIYDGSFTGVKIEGKGITCQHLEQHGIKVFSEQQLEQAAQYLDSLE